MKIIMTGGTGFIGSVLCERLLQKNHQLTVLTRDRNRAQQKLAHQNIRYIESFESMDNSASFDVAVNLSGAPVAQRWTKEYKQQLINSRVRVTQALIEYCKKQQKPLQLLITGSAVGYYGSNAHETLTETSNYSESFSHTLCHLWEQAAQPAQAFGIRTCILRMGVVLGKGGGIIKKLSLPFKMGFGGKIGHGEQWMSWIHIADLLDVIEFCMDNQTVRGVINATSPNPVTNAQFTKVYAKALNRPAIFTVPAVLLQNIYGDMAEEMMLKGQKVLPKVLLEKGFQFRYQTIEQALKEIVSSYF